MKIRSIGLLVITLLLPAQALLAKSDHANTQALPPSYGPGTEIFKQPRYRGNAVDKCLYSRGDRQCGKPAADRFCELNGYRESITYDLHERHGNTFLLGSESQCRGSSCDAFRAVACRQPTNSSGRPPTFPPGNGGSGTDNFFNTPTTNGYPVDKCLYPNRSCGQVTADAFCQSKGYRRADNFRIASARNSWYLKEGRLCNRNCEAIYSVRCDGKNNQGGGTGKFKVFENPEYRGNPVDECLRRDRDCGSKAADAFCKTKGYRDSTSYRVANSRERTWLLGDARYCSGTNCKALRSVRCESRSNNNSGQERDFFPEPKSRGYRVSRCITEGKGCGNKAADEFCRLEGYRSASKYERWRDAGPTIRLGNQQICNKRSCDAIKNVQCSYAPPKDGSNDNRERLFREATYRGYPVSRCLYEGRDCDQYAADEFCRISGYREAVDWRRKEDIGPTIRLGNRKLCEKWSCDGFEDVVCRR